MKNLKQFMSFAAVARNGSFAAAARELGLAPSSVAKSVARLEADLGTRLFHRTTRALRPTAEGEQLHARCARILADIDALELMTAGPAEAPSGLLRVGAPIAYGIRFVVPVLQRMLADHPALSVDVRLSDERVDLVRDGLDATIRIGALDDSGQTARQIGEQPLVLCASADYVRRHGAPRDVAGVEAHAYIAFRMPTSGRERPLTLLVDGAEVQLQPASRFSLSHGEAMVQAVLLGGGIAQVPLHMVGEHLRAGRLVELLPDWRPVPLPVSVVVPASRMMPPRVRSFIDALLARRAAADF